MENNHGDIDDQEKGISKEPLLNNHSSSKSIGGVKTLPFILANEAFEKAALYGLMPNMLLYLMGAYKLDVASGAYILNFWAAASSLTPIIGAFLADSFVGRFRMIGYGSLLALVGMTLLWTTTIVPGVSPSYDETTLHSSKSTTPFKLAYLCIAFFLMSLGSGGIRSSTLAFGADQLSSTGDDENPKSDSSPALESFFNWYYFTVTISMLVSLTCIVYIQDRLGWQVGFAVPLVLMLVSTVSFYSASAFYVKTTPVASVLPRLVQVVVASWRNRHYEFPSDPCAEIIYHVAKGSDVTFPTDRLRFLNKACIVKDEQRDLTPDGMAVDPWCLCTIDQVEDVKAVINVIPLWSTGILLGVSNSGIGSFMVVQAQYMDRHFITSTFEIPPASYGTFGLVCIILWLILYSRVIIPLASKVKGKLVTIDCMTRSEAGLLICFLGTVIAPLVERARRESSINKPMNAMWLVPQLCVIGLGDVIIGVAQIEFFYSEFPKNMSSIAANLFGLSGSISSLVSSLLLGVVSSATKQDGSEGWISSDPNKGHYDYYFWVMAGLNFVNYIYFLFCSRAHKRKNKVSKENKDSVS